MPYYKREERGYLMNIVMSDGSTLSIHSTRVLLEMIRGIDDTTWQALTEQEADDEYTVWQWQEVKQHLTEFAEEVCS